MHAKYKKYSNLLCVGISTGALADNISHDIS